MKKALSICMLILSTTIMSGQGYTQTDATSAPKAMIDSCKQFIGSSLLLLGNLAPGDPVYFFQLNYGYHITRNDIVFAEAITWTYYEPLGNYGSSDETYPGKVRAFGIGVGYQRFIWKHLYATVQATSFLQQFIDDDDKNVQKGFQLYLQSRIGYRFEFFNHRWFIEPSIAFNYWPVNTNFPEAFKKIENGKPNYYLFEPGLNFGFSF
jgi:hypothetical protein